MKSLNNKLITVLLCTAAKTALISRYCLAHTLLVQHILCPPSHTVTHVTAVDTPAPALSLSRLSLVVHCVGTRHLRARVQDVDGIGGRHLQGLCGQLDHAD